MCSAGLASFFAGRVQLTRRHAQAQARYEDELRLLRHRLDESEDRRSKDLLTGAYNKDEIPRMLDERIEEARAMLSRS